MPNVTRKIRNLESSEKDREIVKKALDLLPEVTFIQTSGDEEKLTASLSNTNHISINYPEIKEDVKRILNFPSKINYNENIHGKCLSFKLGEFEYSVHTP